MENTVIISIIKSYNELDNEVYTSCTKIAMIPQDLINLVSDRTVKDVYTLNDVIKITIE